MSYADAGQTAMRMNLTGDAMQQLARYLTGMPGRKNLIWFSGSFPLQFFAVVDNVANGGGITPTIQATGSFEKQMKETADMLVAARVAVYPVDVRGFVDAADVHGYSADRLCQAGHRGTHEPGRKRRPGNVRGRYRRCIRDRSAGVGAADCIRARHNGRSRETNRRASGLRLQRFATRDGRSPQRWIELLHAGLRAHQHKIQRRTAQY